MGGATVRGVWGVLGFINQKNPPRTSSMLKIDSNSTNSTSRRKTRARRRIAIQWHEEESAAVHYDTVGKALNKTGTFFRIGDGTDGLHHLGPNGEAKQIRRGVDLLPIIADLIDLKVYRKGELKSTRLPGGQSTANEMLRTEAFLGNFLPVDRVTATPGCLPDFTPMARGYNDGGPGHRCYYTGSKPKPAKACKTIDTFLDMMDFETQADRTNAVAAGLTVLLRNLWPGGRPIFNVTATKSHSGKDTVLDFAAGLALHRSLSYEEADWALQSNIVKILTHEPDVGMLRIENIRIRGKQLIASAIVERFATDPRPCLSSATAKGPFPTIDNHFVMAFSTNFGRLSEDLANRSLPIHLAPKGSITDRTYAHGNPRQVWLPKNRDRISREFYGIVQRWIDAGKPLALVRSHPCSHWAETIGGMLMVAGYEGFLDNYADSRVEQDPVRAGVAELGAYSQPNEWLRPVDILNKAEQLGLTKDILSDGYRSSEHAKLQGLGKVLTTHAGESFKGKNDDAEVEFVVERARRRFEPGKAEQRYRFLRKSSTPLPLDDAHDNTQRKPQKARLTLVAS